VLLALIGLLLACLSAALIISAAIPDHVPTAILLESSASLEPTDLQVDSDTDHYYLRATTHRRLNDEVSGTTRRLLDGRVAVCDSNAFL
jgi:hypothetical protein